jgi:hypothetical protein
MMAIVLLGILALFIVIFLVAAFRGHHDPTWKMAALLAEIRAFKVHTAMRVSDAESELDSNARRIEEMDL